jgi:hypothetical protein
MLCLSVLGDKLGTWTSLSDKDPVLQNSDPKLGAKKKLDYIIIIIKISG